MLRTLRALSLLAVVLAGLCLARTSAPVATGAAPGAHGASSTASAPAAFERLRFIAHVGAAYYAVHRFVWQPYKAHAFAKGAKNRTKTIVKAAIATAFAYHEVNVAADIANKSSIKSLHVLVAPINTLRSAVNKVGAAAKKGAISVAAITSLQDVINRVTKSGASQGINLKDVQVPIPGLSS